MNSATENTRPQRARVRPLWVLGLALGVCLADRAAPLGSGMGIAYVCVVLASLWCAQPRNTWIAASLCTGLIFSRLIGAHADPLWEQIAYRIIATCIIWTVALVGQWQRKSTRAQGLAQAEAMQTQQSNVSLKAALARTEAAEAQLRRGQRLLDTMATMARIGGWEIDLPTMTPIWSQEVYRIHEVDPSTRPTIGSALEFYPPEARTLAEHAIRKAIEHGDSFDLTMPFITAKGRRLWVRAIGLAERTNGVTTRLSGALQDITEQHDTQMRLARASRSSSEGHWDYDFGTETMWFSASFRELLGFPAQDYRERAVDFRSRVHPDDVELMNRAVERHLTDGTPYDVQVRLQLADDSYRWFRSRGSVEHDDLGRLVSAAGSATDIEDERSAQEELRRVRTRLERAIHGTQDGLWEWEVDSRQLWLSPRFRELLGFAHDEPVADDPEALASYCHPQDRAKLHAATQAHLDGGAPYDLEIRMRTRAGEYRWFHIRGSAERDGAGRAQTLSGSAQDITPQKNAEAARVEAEQRLERAIRGSSDGFFDHALTEGRVWYSPRVREMLGYSPDEPFPHVLLDLMTPEDRERVLAAGKLTFETDAPYDMVYALRTRDGGRRWFRSRGMCDRDADGKPVRFSGSIQDITTQREAEAALVAAKEAAAAANRAKSEFLANMSHEIRTPMNGVLGMTELLLDTPLETVQREFADTIRTSATSLLGVLNDILDFSKIEAGKLEIESVEMDVRECVEDVAMMMAVQAAARNLEFIVNVDPAIPDLVLGDPHRLRQILTNLIGNAVKFTHQGEIVVEALAVGVKSGRALLHFEVHDSGTGMSPEVLARLFQPFVQADASTTRHYGGTGLGLSIVKRLVEMMGGQVSVVSDPGQGSTFSFTLPCPLVEGAISTAAAGSFSPQGRRVLVVDDNQTNRRVLCGQLQPAGYEVQTAGDVDEALNLLAKSVADNKPVEVVIADDQMPGCDGASLAARVHSVPALSDVQLIMLTSLDRHGNVQRLTELGFAGYLTKPVRGRELRACVERVLNLDAAAATTIPRLITRGLLATEAGPSRFKGRVLIVEDNAVNQQVARRFLERLGCEVEVAENGLRAVEFCARARYDLILMDVQMPVMDGLAATREIRRHEDPGSRTPIIALTASAMTDELERCIAAGMDGLLTKPLEPARLGDILERYGLAGNSMAAAGLTAPASLRPPGHAIDLARLRSIVGDDDEFVHELCRTYLASSARIVDELRQALLASDRTQLAAMAHKLKGGSNSVCASRVGDLAAALERNSRAGAMADLKDSVDQIGAALQECAGFIEARVA
ncbi:MAG TPA: PAS domain-containing protein [Steroidobacteraceae bacterium]|nr:PAS domain-containing protein [Steroidobacteraceae bacterium]